jgi:hypothetical protein
MAGLSPKVRNDIMRVLYKCIPSTIDEIMAFRIDNPVHKKVQDGYQVDPRLTIKAGSAFRTHRLNAQQELGICLEELVQIVEDDKFRIEMKPDSKPVLIVNTIDGKATLCNYLATLKKREDEYQSEGTNLVGWKGMATIAAALFEGPRYEDIKMGIIGVYSHRKEKLILQAVREEGRFEAFANNKRLYPAIFTPSIEQSRALVIESTNNNSEGIGRIRAGINKSGIILEARPECTGATTGDLIALLNGQWQTWLDFRAKYRESWATLRLVNVAPIIPLVRALGWQWTSIDNISLDDEVLNNTLEYEVLQPNNLLYNRELTMMISTNEALHKAVMEHVQKYLVPSVRLWNLNKAFENGPTHSDYDVLTPMKFTPFKVSYLGQHKKTKEKQFLHILVMNEDGKEWCRKHGFKDHADYIKQECKIIDSGLTHDNILHPIRMEVNNGRVVLIEPPCDMDLSDIYKDNVKLDEKEYGQFFSHAIQIAQGLAAAHNHKKNDIESPIYHRDLKLENILLKDNIIKNDDWGVTALMMQGYYRTCGQKAVGSILTRPPEEHDKPGVASPQTDIYSLGALLFRMLTGEYPVLHFEKKINISDPGRENFEEEQMKYKKSDSFHGDMYDRLRGVPHVLSLYILKLLERDLNIRPRSMADVAHQLAKIRDRLKTYKYN